MIKNEENHGFIVKQEEFIQEINALVRIMEHPKSGAKLMHIKNDDKNKTFSIAFRTPPSDDTGLPHILEHAVLCGSRKFPPKEPFVELAKGSLNTYLNAMTYSDKTMYPISSQNPKDFVNLMDVYLDAVFFPNIYKNPMILRQEGWSYKLEDPEDDIEYQGVVYNEMKGAFSSPEGILFRKIEESLFPDTIYSFESGGDPTYIPDLSQEQFLAFHKKYYHPSNSYICLYGDGDIEEHLKLIDEEYLSHFDKMQIESGIPVQEPFSAMKEMKLEYPIAEGEAQQNKTYLALNFVIEDTNNTNVIMAMEILEHLLLETPAAPLKKALIDAGIGQDIFGVYNTSIQQPVFSIVVKNASEDKKDEFYNIVVETLTKLVEDGIDKKLIEGAISSKEFELREADFGGYSKGLLYAMDSLKSWLYDGDPFAYLKYEAELREVKKGLETTYLEEMIQKYILKNTHRTFITMTPKAGMTKETDQIVGHKLQQFKAALSHREILELVEQTKKLKIAQETPDTKEDLETIPTLALSDLEKKVSYPDYEIKQENDIPFIVTPAVTNQIAYINLYYDLRGIDQEMIPYIGMLVGMLGKLDTAQYSYEELNNQIDIHTGGIQYHTLVLNEIQKKEDYIPKLVVRSKALYDKVPYLSELIKEIMQDTQFTQASRIREVIREMKSRMEMSINQDGHRVAFGRLSSYFSQKGYYEEGLKGLKFYETVALLEENFDKMQEEIIENLEKAYKFLNNKKRMTIGITAEKDQYDTIKSTLLTMVESMDAAPYSKANTTFDLTIKNEALLAPFNVQYVAKGYDYTKLGYTHNGSLSVLRSILGLDYLWNKVRVQNGAYGCFAEFARSGNMFFVSYRDPNVGKTLETYNGAYEYIKDFTVSKRDMTKYIIGTISKLDFPVTPAMSGERAQRFYISGVREELLQKERDEILATDQAAIRNLGPMIKKCMEQDYICVLGNHDKIKQEAQLFDHLIEVFK